MLRKFLSLVAEVCPRLDPPENGSVHTTGTTVNSTANYTCNYGYELMGNKNRTCQNNGWDGNPPTCGKL